jgi:hypothetical protein
MGYLKMRPAVFARFPGEKLHKMRTKKTANSENLNPHPPHGTHEGG